MVALTTSFDMTEWFLSWTIHVQNITTLSGGFLVTNCLAHEQQMLRETLVSLFSADSIQNPLN